MTMLGVPLGARLAFGHQGSDSARVGPILPWKPRVSVSHNSAMCAPSYLQRTCSKYVDLLPLIRGGERKTQHERVASWCPTSCTASTVKAPLLCAMARHGTASNAIGAARARIVGGRCS